MFRTDAFITDDGFSVVNDQLEGAGFTIELDFYGNIDFPLQPGIYSINDLKLEASVEAVFYLDYDPSLMINSGVKLDSGNVLVEPYSTGYYIVIDAVDTSGNPFHGNYLGNTTTIQ